MNSVKTGFHDYDDIFGKLTGGQLVLIGGRPAMGKSTFAMNLVHNVCMDKSGGVLVFSLKTEGYRYVRRLIELNPRDKVSEWELEVDDTSGISTEYIDNRTSMMKQVSMVVIDYLQLLECEGEGKCSDAAGKLPGLKRIAEKYEIPVIILSELSRACENRRDHRPIISDLSRSKRVPGMADIIMLLYREDYYRRVDVQDDQKAEVIIAKHPLATDLPLTIEMTYNAVAGGFMNRGHTHK